MKKFSLDSDSKMESGFKVPESYFDHLSSEILTKIEAKKVSQHKVFSLKKWIYAAAAVLILALSIPFLNSNAQPSFDDIDTSSLENYIAYHSNITSYDLVNSIEINELDDLQIDLNIDEVTVEDLLITNPNLENYITE